MQLPRSTLSVNATLKALRAHYREPEAQAVERLLPYARLSSSMRDKVHERAATLAGVMREAGSGAHVQALLNEFALSTQEGVLLMCLAEALLRVPDDTTTDQLIHDKLAGGDWSAHLGQGSSLFVKAAALGLLLSGKVSRFSFYLRENRWQQLQQLTLRLGKPVIRAAMRQAMRVMGGHFVLGQTITEALKTAQPLQQKGYYYSYDMLGEAARTMADATCYWRAYRDAIAALAAVADSDNPRHNPGISVKLSALHPRYEYAQADRLMAELLPRLIRLALLAKQANISLTLDAEEASRLELSLAVIERLQTEPQLAGWEGLGVAVQAYQKRSLDLVNWLVELSRRSGRKMMVRLVKGAYWDTEIKLAQVDGLSGYPVFTRKAATDLSYQACAQVLLANRDIIFPQFATHNAYTVALILGLAGDSGGYEFQRLHGMGEGLYDYLVSAKIPCRIYAPVGAHQQLLAYLVRRLLENGANSSFVNGIVDRAVSIESLISDPVAKVVGWPVKANPKIPLPAQLYGRARRNSAGIDLADPLLLQEMAAGLNRWCAAHLGKERGPTGVGYTPSINPANCAEVLGEVKVTEGAGFGLLLERAEVAAAGWAMRQPSERTAVLEGLADSMERHRHELIALCIKEAGKTLKDALAEVREAVDFCRYYAGQARQLAAAHGDRLQPRGVILCVSPWNFPLAIFLGQISAALAVGNAVIAKPAGHTLLVAQRALALLEEEYIPPYLVQLVNCAGRRVGEALLPDPRVKAVLFTGSTATAATIADILAQRDGEPVPLVAETGGQNCMLVDSTALPEQVVDDVITSGFQSAGQRCSALRVLFLQEEIADQLITMLTGAMRELRIGDPGHLATDVGPVIDADALQRLEAHAAYMAHHGRLLYQCELSAECDKGTFFAPRLYEINDIAVLRGEVFGPVVHVVRYRAEQLEDTLAAVNSSGFGLTFGVHSRIQQRAEQLASEVQAGNVYVNRNMIGAVVGVQPFGGRGLSGTGPKAGGPSYLYRLVRDTRTEIPAKPPGGWSAVACGSADDGLLDKWLTPLLAQHRDWCRRGLDERQQLLEQSGFASLKVRLRETCTLLSPLLDAPQLLPGPTGEENLLFYEPRGVLLCITEDAAVNQQIVTALLAGNSVLHLSLQELAASPKTALQSYCFAGQINADLLQLLLISAPIDGVMLTAPQALAALAGRLLRQRSGAILPVITEQDEPLLSKRILLEKAVSINTTASGGNASLLAMGDGD